MDKLKLLIHSLGFYMLSAELCPLNKVLCVELIWVKYVYRVSVSQGAAWCNSMSEPISFT